MLNVVHRKINDEILPFIIILFFCFSTPSYETFKIYTIQSVVDIVVQDFFLQVHIFYINAICFCPSKWKIRYLYRWFLLSEIFDIIKELFNYGKCFYHIYHHNVRRGVRKQLLFE